MKRLIFIVYILLTLSGIIIPVVGQNDSNRYFIIQVIDQETHRGVPMVELRTTSKRLYITDSNGIIAFDEANFLNQEIWFTIFSHGYEYPGEGIMLNSIPGKSAVVELKRLNIAERLYRLTGQDIYGESVLVNYPVPIRNQALNGRVMGQDTYINIEYKGKIYWFWGDTFGPAHFNGSAAGAISELPENGGLDPGVGVDLKYLVDSTGFSKPMITIPRPGLVWIDWLVVLPDRDGNEQLYAKYSRMGEQYIAAEQGIAIFNDLKNVFEPLVRVNSWTGSGHSSAHPVRIKENETEYLYIFHRLGLERVKTDINSISDPESYEYFTCNSDELTDKAGEPESKSSDRTRCSWKAGSEGRELMISKDASAFKGWFEPIDIISGKNIAINPASVFWNEYRERWIMIAYEFTGAVWFLEADTPTGPWTYGRKIITHQNYDFYNVGQHPLFDQENGRIIFLEGTYTTGFSGNFNPTPLYDYNQMMYRLAMDSPELSLPAPVYFLNRENQQGNYLMRDKVDSLDLWEQVKEVSFFALPTNSAKDNLIPVYGINDISKGYILTTTPPTTGNKEPEFYALPSEASENSMEEPITGIWRGMAKMKNGIIEDFKISLQQKGDKITGVNVISGYFKEGVLTLELDLMGRYLLTGALYGNTMSGEYKSLDDTEEGSWKLVREKTNLHSNSALVVDLYEYRAAGKKGFLYSVNPKLDDDSLIRSEKPLCRVWLNPGSVLVLDNNVIPAKKQ